MTVTEQPPMTTHQSWETPDAQENRQYRELVICLYSMLTFISLFPIVIVGSLHSTKPLDIKIIQTNLFPFFYIQN